MPRGRPRLPHARRKQRSTRVSDAEDRLLCDAAAALEVPVGRFLRDAGIEKAAKLMLELRREEKRS